MEKQETLFCGFFAFRTDQEITRNRLFQFETKTLTELGGRVGHCHSTGALTLHDVQPNSNDPSSGENKPKT
ncbi:MAG: hypothetical protein V7703_10755 [Hyphomicrobiales bacterium]